LWMVMAYNPEDVGSKPTTGILVLVLAKLIAWCRQKPLPRRAVYRLRPNDSNV
jgi:hypothetical protein